VPYRAEEIASAEQAARSQAEEISSRLAEEVGIEADSDTEMIALIAYLQRLGTGPIAPTATDSAEPEVPGDAPNEEN